MTAAPPLRPSLGFDAFSTAVALGVIAGALSVVWSPLDGLTAALAALAVAAAVLRYGERGGGRRPTATVRGVAVVALAGAAAVVFLDPPATVVAVRGLILGLSLVPWWAVERRRPSVPRPSGGSSA